MFLVSVYFDEKTEKWLQGYINNVAEKTGNSFMVDNKVPPHITIAAFETNDVMLVIEALKQISDQLVRGQLQWASIGSFSSVIFAQPVLNEYIHKLSRVVNECITQIDGVTISKMYQPFNWIPHTTIAKKLSKDEMQIAFRVMQNSFGMFSGEVVRIGVAKTKPYEDIICMEL